jgi:hypothetical protein
MVSNRAGIKNSSRDETLLLNFFDPSGNENKKYPDRSFGLFERVVAEIDIGDR